MATSSVVIAGATYSDVPSVTLKDTSNNDVSFILTSDADATASDIRKNKIAYSQGQKIVGDYELNLQEKTATPTTSTQVITADSGGEITCIDEQNQQCYYVMTSPKRQYINLTWIEDLVVGETYHFYIVFDRRSYGGTQYYFVYDGDKEFTGFPMSFSLTSTTSTRTDVLNLSATELYRNGVSDDDGTNYMTLVVTKQGESYDGLSQVTVNPIPSDYVHVEGTIPITANGTVDVSAYQYAEVNVSGGSQTQSKTATPTTSTQTITPDSGYLLSSVVVNPIPSQYIVPSGTKSITSNGTSDVTSYASVSVNVTPSLEAKTNITPTTSSQTITPSSGYDGLASVQIDAIPSNYIDTTDATASASDIRTGKSGYVNGSKVNGSLVVNTVYVGSTDPSSSFGNDGDIYIKVV